MPFEKYASNEAQMDEIAKNLLLQLTLEEKISFLDAHHPAVERLGLPEYRLEAEGAHGVVIRAEDSEIGGDGTSTVFPQPFGLSMTWDKALMKQVGSGIGDEARVYNKLVLLFPTIDMERDPRWGRNEEAYGEDPYLAGQLGVELIKGAQGERQPYLKVATTVKHFYANNYEFEREWADSKLPEALKYDYYLRVFSYAIKEGRAASLMTSYNQVDGVINMLNPQLTSLVREQWGADGYFVSDGKAFEILPASYDEHKTYASYAADAIKAGLDCFLTYDSSILYKAVRDAMEQGLLTEDDINPAVFHQLRVLVRLGLYPGLEGNPYVAIPRSSLNSQAHAQLSRKASLEAVTLLKNDGILPLQQNSTHTVAVVGQLGDENMTDWYSGKPPYEVTPLDGIRAEFPNSQIRFADGCDIVGIQHSGTGKWLRLGSGGSVSFDADAEGKALFRVHDWGFGTGFQECSTHKYLTTTPAGDLRCDADSMWGWFVRELFFMEEDGVHITAERPFDEPTLPEGAGKPEHNIYAKPYDEGGLERINATLAALRVEVVVDGLAAARDAASNADAAIVLLGNHTLIGARETVDRPHLALPASYAKLFDTVVTANSNTILSVVAGYQYAIEQQERQARAVLFTTHGVQEVGMAIAQTLSGRNNPAGRLSQTWYADSQVMPNINDYDIASNKLTYLYHDGPVAHEFGFGLSYTDFTYSDVHIEPKRAGSQGEVESVHVTFIVTNSGNCDGDEVPQLYFAAREAGKDESLARPVKRLVGFDRITLAVGESRQLSFQVPREELSFYSPTRKTFVFSDGIYEFMVGASSADIRLNGTVSLN